MKLFKGEIGAKPSAGKKTVISEFIRRYIEYLNTNSHADNHSDLARIRSLQNFFARTGIRYIAEISPVLINEFNTTILAGRKPKTIRNYVGLLKAALNKAIEWELIEYNPIAKVKLPKVVKTFNFYGIAEVQRLIDKAEEPLKTGIIILAYTGMRRGELFHLRRRDVDLKAGNIRIWPYGSYSPKGKRPRTIPISDEIRNLIRYLAKNKEPDDYLFRPFLSEHRLYKRFAAHAKNLGIKGTLHDLRHTFASHLSMSGTPIPVIKELLGHSDISTSMIYAHPSPDQHQKAISKLTFKKI